MSGKETPSEMTGAKALVTILEEMGVDAIFGYPGGANLPIFDELIDSPIQTILTRHEQGAIHMAEGYARVKGRPGVCLATSGPGATNLVTGLADALLDSTPLVALTAQIPRNMIGQDSFQEVDCFNITMPVTKHNELVYHEKDLVHSLKAAFYIANSGRKGPVLLDIPTDVLTNPYPHDLSLDQLHLPGYRPTIRGDIGQIKRALKLLKKAERPLICYGGGVISAGAAALLREFAEATRIPVVRTLMGTGVFSDDHPLFCGLIGTHGNSLANKAVQRDADVIFAVGTKLGNRAVVKNDLFGQNAKIIHLDIDPAELGKNVEIDLPIVGDIRECLEDMLERIREKPLRPEQEPWLKWVEKTNMLSTKDNAGIMEIIFRELSMIDQKLNVSTDVGRHQMWANHFCTNPMHLPLITSGGLGTMGFGLPAAIGAWFAEPETPVINLSGDGSFMMNMQEFITAVEYKVPLTVVILNDYRLGMIRELQTSKYGKRYTAHDFGRHVSFAAMAEAMGGKGVEVHHPEKIGPSLKKAIASRVPTILEFDLEKLIKASHLHVKAS